MKKNILHSALALTMILMVASCDFLDVKPISYITNESFWQTEDDVNGALTGMYVQFRGAAEHDLYVLGEARSEVLTVGSGGAGGYDIYYNNTINQSNMPLSWMRYYTLINSCNLILKYGPKVSYNDENKKNRALAQAYSMRAFTYFVLTRTWGDVIERTEPVESTNADVLYKERTPQADIIKLIKADIEQALSLYPDDNHGTQKAMWSKPATQALKAEVFLWTGKRMNGGNDDITTALNALNAIPNNLKLLPEFGDVFAYDKKGNEEVLMASQFKDLESGTNYFKYMWIHPSAVPADIDDETRAIIMPPGEGQGIIVASEELRKQYHADDLRRNNTFWEIYTTNEGGEKQFYVSVVTKCPGLVKDGTRRFLNDIIIYRYADILLLKAEAKNALGQDPTAEINEVRKRAFGDKYQNHVYVNSTKEKNDEAILKERLLELAFEGKRWWDLVRFDKAFDLVPSLRDKKGNDYMLLFPLPLSTLSAEPKVKQNPGWDK